MYVYKNVLAWGDGMKVASFRTVKDIGKTELNANAFLYDSFLLDVFQRLAWCMVQ